MRILRSIPCVPAVPVALTVGNFDGVHLGHQAMLAKLGQAARRLRLPACVMTFEPHPREFFAPDQAPTRLTSLREKLELFAELGVERVHVCRFNYEFARTTPEEFVARILVRGLATRWLLVGDDFRFGARRAGDFNFLKQAAARHGFEVEAMSSVTHGGVRVSSTAIREALAGGDLAQAEKLLGRVYSISGRVVRGDMLGKKLGFPTANVQLRHNRPPLAGIFAVQVRGVGRGLLPGVASLGVRPTVVRNGRPTLEVHLLEFDRDIYGEHMRVEFLHKFRDEQKYADLEALKRQIARDVEDAEAFFHRRRARAIIC